MAELMGVRVHAADEAVDDFEKLSSPVPTSGSVASGSSRFVLDGKLNASFKAVNLLLDSGATVRRVDQASAGLEMGDFIVSGGFRSERGGRRDRAWSSEHSECNRLPELTI